MPSRKPNSHSATTQSGDRRRYGAGKSILYTAIIVCSFFLLAEGSLRIWAYFFRSEYERYDSKTETFILVPGEYPMGSAKLRINSDGFVGKELMEPSPGLFRIFALGDSCTFGDGDSAGTYSALLEQKLAESSDNNIRYEVVNGGVEGADSAMALRRLKDRAPDLAPRIVIVYIGWNDLMKHDPTAQRKVSGGWTTFARALDSLWITKGFKKAIFFYLRPYLNPPGTGPQEKSNAFVDFTPDVYEQNLREIIAFIRSIGAEPLLVTLPTVVTEYMALPDLRRSNVIFPYFRSAYSVHDLLDLLASYNRTIRKVAGREKVILVDLAERFSQYKDRTRLFYDTMHPSREGREIIAADLYDALVDKGLLE